ncbi:DNA internalization-related competence protein ComEC/Rec2 [Chromobacterium alticapitis]|uniref:DNA internalization-related competence protein ComEC/Rec2 n=1 Tax=Chromobacterium alticapitis TaxID=2073169 RepID=A0A2S5DA54_9NEIS|nr:DNA internalization-related competence protein ComEC/Rec2 [Chromobacterium alticapitis]POZ59956.1 DNA internalization-related competence protein ComEC/Rec2 [Chromobacterium alticapitis]
MPAWGGWVLGIAICAFLPELPSASWLGAWIVGAAVLARRAGSRWRPWLVGLLAVSLGLGYAAWRAQARLEQELSPAWAKRPIAFVASVRGLPVPGEYGTRLTLEVERTLTPGAALPPRVQLFDYRKQEWPPGSRWRLAANFKPRRGSANAFGFDAEQWLWSEGLLASGSAGKARERLADSMDLTAWVDGWRATQVARVERILGVGRESALVSALTVGAQQRVAAADWRLFAATGLTHIVSISGLHITMMAGMVAWACARALRRWPLTRSPRVATAVAAWLAAAVYALLAGFSVPTQRTLFMLLVASGCLISRRQLSPFQAWWLALALVLALDPFSVLAPGLWLSFGLVAALMLGTWARRRPESAWRAALSGQWAAGVASLVPLAAWFGGFPLVSPLANALAIPYVSMLLTPLSLLAVLSPWDGLLPLAGIAVRGFYLGVEWLAQGPAWHVAGSPWPLLALAAAGSVWLIAPRGVPGKGLAAVLLLPLLLYRPPGPAPGAVRATVFDVGQGLSLLVQTANHALLFDTGAGDAERVVLPQLRGLGVDSLDVLLLSHHDADHDGAANGVLRALPVRRLLAGQPQSLAPWRAQPCRQGDGWSWDGVRFEVLGPPPAAAGDEDNARSCVLRVSGARHALLVSGDAPLSIEDALAAQYGDRLRSTVLIAGHHGSRTSSGEAWLNAARPRLALISAGYLNRYRHPHPEVLRRLREHGALALRTDQDGALTLELADEPAWRCLRRESPRYWRARGDCGGEVMAD